MRDSDLPQVLAIAAAVPTAPHWPEFEFRRMLSVAAGEPARRAAWVAGPEHEPLCGFALASCAAGEAELETIVTAPHARRQGFGRALAEAALIWSRAAGARRILLEARASNHPALTLYASLGFRVDGTRRRYYRNPDEDAVLMSLAL